ncbi:TIGR03546 family protein [Bacteriovorax sp. BSW11_IV]|uniref:TIGR03546 family protein n=1 Tax=Bacteriovorax sp. BSW11_IV TaxID=1353529 RepID=UPI00038A37D9|nr:TIGR03546 family protein [Bacteriovorax sp. BSW11_IV]EQC48614.1 TIGR03546 family protein [Bacteriovorax sp. BSW11_IV]
MTIILKQIFALLKLLNSDTGENQLAAGIACGLILGFAPVFSLQTILVFIMLFFLRIQMGAAFTSAFFFAFVAYVFDPIFDSIGGAILEMGAFKGLFETLYMMPIIPFTKFYNSVVMGAGIVSFLLFPVIFFVSKGLIVKYRESVVERFKQTKFWKAVKATGFYKWYAKYEELYG